MRKFILLVILVISFTGISFNQEMISLTNEFNSSRIIDVFHSYANKYFIIYENLSNIKISRIKYGFCELKGNYNEFDFKEITPNAFANQTGAKAIQYGKELVYIAYVDYRHDSEGDIYLQLIDKNGIVWDSAGVPVCEAKGIQKNIEIATDSLGNVFVAWIDYRDDAEGDIYVQKFNIFGSELWKKNGISVSNLKGIENNISIVPDQKGGVIVSYTDRTNYYSQVYVQRIDESGKKIFGNYGKFISKPGVSADLPKLFFRTDLGITCFWTSYEDKTKVYYQRISSLGIEEWSENGEELSTIKEDQLNPAYYFLDNNFFVIFNVRSYFQNSIYIQKIADNGVPLYSSRGQKIIDIKNDNVYPKLVKSDDNYLVYFLESEGNYYNSTLYAQLISRDGMILGEDSEIKTIKAEFDVDSYILINKNGDKLDLFFDKSFGINKSIFYCSIKKKEKESPKNFLISNFDVMISDTAVKLWWITLNETKNNEMYLERKSENGEWQTLYTYKIKESSEKKFYTYDDIGLKEGIYYYRIKYLDSKGKDSYTENQKVNYSGKENSKYLLQNNPNPFNSSTKITFVLPEPSFVKITVYNGRAEEIETLANGYYSEGLHEVVFKATDNLSSGIYFYKLETKNYIDVKKMVYTK